MKKVKIVIKHSLMLVLVFHLYCGSVQAQQRKVSKAEIYTHVLNEFLEPLSEDSKRNMLVVNHRVKKLTSKRKFEDPKLKSLLRKSRLQLIAGRIRSKDIKVSKEVVLLSPAEIDGFFKTDIGEGWKTFYQRYPAALGIVQMSRPVFSRADGLAMIYVSHQGGPLFGSGELWLISLGEKLKTIRVFPLWVS
ncbi:MAG: hypothetical protein AAFO69_15285 [Bacteroidota bacterium]